jgi:hypothetical protein
MTTSAVTAWSLTARDHITQALRENAILSSGEDPSADELSDCQVRLNALLKSWGTKAPALWQEASTTATITANVASVALAAGVQDVIAARVVVSATNHRQLTRWDREDYQVLPNKIATGSPSVYYLSQSIGVATLYVWPVPTANTTLSIDFVRVPETVTDASQTVDFPEEYQEALYANLAVRCAGLFGQQPAAELVMRAQRLEMELLDAGRPGAYYLRAACA